MPEVVRFQLAVITGYQQLIAKAGLSPFDELPLQFDDLPF